MTHNHKISLSKEPKNGSVVSCKSMTIRERALAKLFGKKQKLMVLIPGSSVSTVSITEVPEGGQTNE